MSEIRQCVRDGRLGKRHRVYRLAGQLKEEGKPPQPELSQAEYFHFLWTVKAMGEGRIFFLMKVFATAGISMQDLQELTVEAVKEDRVVYGKNRKQ